MVRKNATKKIISLSMGSLMLISSLTGCGKGETAPTSTSTSTTTDTNKNVVDTPQKQKLVIGMQASPNVIDYETNYLTQLVEEQMDVDLEFLLLPADTNDAKTKFSLMVSSGSKLPDVFNMGLDEFTVRDYAKKGVFVGLKDYYNDPTIAVNYNKLDEKVKEIAYKGLNIDGEMYGLLKYGVSTWNEAPYRAWINEEWLDTLGLEKPNTTDEFYEVLKAFAEQDPNGNGKKDEIPMVGAKSGWGLEPMVYLMNAFVYANPNKAYLNLEDGKIVPAYTQEGWKQGLEYINKLVEENLLSPLSFTQDVGQLKVVAANKENMTGVVTAGSLSVFSIAPGEVGRMNLIAPLTGPEGVSVTPYNPTLPGAVWYITKDCQDPELAFRVGDNFLEPDMSILTRYGKKGENWTDDPAVCELYEGIFERTRGIKTQMYEFPDKNVWGVPQNIHWQHGNPSYIPEEIQMTVGIEPKSKPIEERPITAVPIFHDLYVPKLPEEVIVNLQYGEEEMKKISVLKTTIDEFVKTKMIEFATGNASLNDWDKYLNELEAMGLSEYIAITQAAYDRMK